MTRAQNYINAYRMHRAALQDLYAELPSEQGNFKAWEGGMSFVGLADHLSASTARIPAMLSGEKPVAAAEGSADLASARTRLAASTEQVVDMISALSDEDFDRQVSAFGGREMPIGALMEFLVQHEAHHKGQAWLMARMVGVTPPFFVKLG
ncbi:DinB family protein [Deinococcus psychrotolerans]|uniref:DinB family protein n=1 Tax=Deinococcus psychrotolerans TaxID=2489213 RepID=A0A3G8YMQ1_9DEIO|nr:DinB family protein [Deinococcus psychrotolerans]AZI42426.1 DinB family protein [Deinococcus psychrotolerans]